MALYTTLLCANLCFTTLDCQLLISVVIFACSYYNLPIFVLEVLLGVALCSVVPLSVDKVGSSMYVGFTSFCTTVNECIYGQITYSLFTSALSLN